jgi:hypothetical protein
MGSSSFSPALTGNVEDKSMPQANRRNSTTASNIENLDAKSLIAAHRKAVSRLKTTEAECKKIAYPELVRIAVPELGPSFIAYSLETLDEAAQAHIKNNGLNGLQRIEFLRRIEEYKTAFQLLQQLHEGWRQRNHIDAIEDEHGHAYDAEGKAWKALVKEVSTHPRDAHLIAKYVASKDVTLTNVSRYLDMLIAIASSVGKAVRT